MKKVLIILSLSLGLLACDPPHKTPEPHLELGQKITFPGSSSAKSYIILGYREQAESETTKYYRDQSYIVFMYVNDEDDVKQGVIHRNAILKN